MARVTIATFPFPRDLMLVEARFQDEEIRYWLLDEHAHTVTHIGAGLGGVRMQVEQDDVGRARQKVTQVAGAGGGRKVDALLPGHPGGRHGQVVVRPMNYLAMSYDHRIIDGREAVLGLVAMKEALEDPARLLFHI